MSVFFAPPTDGRIWKADIYVRTAQADGHAIRCQIAYLTAFVQSRQDLCLHRVFVDDGFSGVTFDRPGFQGMMEDLRSKGADCVVVKDLPRLGRNTYEIDRLIAETFQPMGVRFLSACENLDSLAGYHSLYDSLLKKGGTAG